MGMDPWILSEGVKLARAITDPATKAGFQVTLGGSVLLLGKSAKDIDLFFIPKSKNSSPAELVAELEKLWGAGTKIDLKYEERTRRALQEQENDLNARFNPAPMGAQVGRTFSREHFQPFTHRTNDEEEPVRDNIGGYPVYDVEPGDVIYRGGPSLPEGYQWITRGRNGRIVVSRSTPATFPSGWTNSIIGDAAPPKKHAEKDREPFRLALTFQRRDDRIDAFIV